MGIKYFAGTLKHPTQEDADRDSIPFDARDWKDKRIAELEAAVLGAVHLLRDDHQDAAVELLEQTYHRVGKQ